MGYVNSGREWVASACPSPAGVMPVYGREQDSTGFGLVGQFGPSGDMVECIILEERHVSIADPSIHGIGYDGEANEAMCPCSDVRAEQKLLDASWWIVDSRMARIAGQGTPSGFPCAVNNQLRTGADKGNPTV